MAYAQSNVATQQKNQVMFLALTLFVAIVAAVVMSAVIVSSMVKGQIANALDVAPVTATQNALYNPSVNAPACVAPAAASSSGGSSAAAGSGSGYVPLFRGAGGISGSFNNTSSITNTNTENNSTVNTDSHNFFSLIAGSFNRRTTTVRDNGNTFAPVFSPTNNTTTNTTTTTTTVAPQDNDTTVFAPQDNDTTTTVVAPVTVTTVNDNDGIDIQ